MKRRLTVTLTVTVSLCFLLGSSVAAAPAFPQRIDLPDGWFPEGITSGRGTSAFVGSLADGAIRRVDLRTGDGSVLVDGASGTVAVGVDYEPSADRLWVAGGDTGEVRVYDASSGELLGTYSFPSAGFLNDLVVTREAVYVTDSFAPQLGVIPLDRGGALPDPAQTATLPLSGEFTFVPGQFNANGIVASRGWLIVVMSASGELLRVDPETGQAAPIDLGGATAASGDGLELRGSILYVVRNFLNQVAAFRLGAKLESADLLGSITSSDLDIPTTATVAAGRLWAVNARFTTPPTPDTDYWITRLPVRP
ncbi:MAG: PQQ-like beta-propeller repeat protein [Chloroflexota bacterium]|nr:PQQ-like beta-propeller repeat protein [Chloroflexota bacterium]